MKLFFNPDYVHFLLLFPFLGLLLHYLFIPKQLKIITIILFSFYLLTFTGYEFMTDWFYEACATLILACLFALSIQVLKIDSYSILIMIILTILVLVFSFGAVFSRLYDSSKVKNKWKNGDYSVEYIESRNFVGTWHHYELHQTHFFGLFDKKITSKNVLDSTQICIVNFDTLNIGFNKCINEIIELK